jgi:hypothetical protein
LQLWLAFSLQLDTSSDEQMDVLLILIAQQQVGNRPGRIEPRAVKRRPKPYPLLSVPRAQARQTVRKFGHPEKLK